MGFTVRHAQFSASLTRLVGTAAQRGDDRQLVPDFRLGKLSCGEAATGSVRLDID